MLEESNNDLDSIESQEVYQNQIIVTITNENTLIKMDIYKKSWLVKILSIMDITIQVINLTLSIINKNLSIFMFLYFPLCLAGYYGANYYKKNYILAYTFYLFIMVLLYLFIIFYKKNFLYIIVFMIELYFFSYTMRFYNLLSILDENILESLRNGWKPDDNLSYSLF